MARGLAVLVALAVPAAAEDLVIRGIEITATLVDPPVTAKGYLRLMPDNDVSVTILAADLTATTTGAVIPANAITLPSEATLKKGQPKDLRVEIEGIREAGKYVGDFDLYVNDPKHPKATPRHLTAHATVNVNATPKLALVGSAPIVWTLVHCSNALTCLVVDTLLPSTMRANVKVVRVEDQHRAATSLAGQLITTTGTGTEAAASVVTAGDGVAGNQFVARATFTRSALVPGVYPALVQLKPPERGDTFSQPVTIDVRVGWSIALVAIVAGVIVGRLAQALATPLFQFQSGLFSRVYQIRRRAEELADATLRTVILERLSHAIDRAEMATAADAQLTADVEAIAAQTLAAERFDRVALLVANEPDAVKRADLRKRLDDVRPLIVNSPIADANTQLAAIEADVGAVAPSRMAIGTLAASRGVGAPAPAPADASRAVRILSFLAGTRGPTSASTKYAAVRPILYLVLLVLLCLVGFNTLYLKAPAGFGSGGLFDHLGLFMWGLTADVAQGTFQRLPK